MFLYRFFLILFIFSASFFINSEQRNLSIVLDLTYSDASINPSFCQLLVHGLMDSSVNPILTNEFIWNSCKNTRTLKKDDWLAYKKQGYILLVPKELKSSGLNLEGFVEDLSLLESDSRRKIKFDSFRDNINKLLHNRIFKELTCNIKSKTFVKLFDQLVTPKDQKNNFEWNVYLAGHGFALFSICGLTDTSFLDFVNVLQTKINTHAFYYNSCYSGGKKNDYIYGTKKFKFPIFSQCFNDFTTSTFKNFNFKELFEKLGNVQTDNIKTYISLVENVFDQYETFGLNPMNIVNIRFPGEENFQAVTIEGKICLASNLKKDEAKNEKLNHKYLVFDIANFDQTLNLDEDTNIVSFIKGDAYHYIKKIEASGLNGYKLFANFFAAQDLFYRKIFIVDEMDCLLNDKEEKLKKVIFFLNSFTPYQKQSKSFEVFFIADDMPHVLCLEKYNCECRDPKHYCWDYKYKKIDDSTKIKYLDLYEQIKSKIDSGKQPNKKVYDKDVRQDVLLKSQIFVLSPWVAFVFLNKMLSYDIVNQNKCVNLIKNTLLSACLTNLLYKQAQKMAYQSFEKLLEQEV